MKKQTEIALKNTGRYCTEQRKWVGFSDLTMDGNSDNASNYLTLDKGPGSIDR
jgi:hypothetical protein